MKRVIIEVPDGWKPGECKVCSSYSICGLKEMGADCPLANVKEVKPVRIQSIRSDKGLLRITLAPVFKEGTHLEIFCMEDK